MRVPIENRGMRGTERSQPDLRVRRPLKVMYLHPRDADEASRIAASASIRSAGAARSGRQTRSALLPGYWRNNFSLCTRNGNG